MEIAMESHQVVECRRQANELDCGSDGVEAPQQRGRTQRLADLFAAPALPIAEVALFIGVPLSTIDKLRAQGHGPRTFKIGRRLFVLQEDLRDWLHHLRDMGESS
jgi:hypothetical protein